MKLLFWWIILIPASWLVFIALGYLIYRALT